jgi:hypothetical protein
MDLKYLKIFFREFIMKKHLITIVALIALYSTSYGHFKQGDLELGFNVGMGMMTTEYKFLSKDYSESLNFFGLSVTPGYYIVDGFSIEPEIGITAIEEEYPSFFLLGNLSYTYIQTNSNWGPFIKLGYGISNSYNMFPGEKIYMHSSNEMDLSILNVSAGIKAILGNVLVLRSELNYRAISKDGSDSSLSWLSVLTGFSILF